MLFELFNFGGLISDNCTLAVSSLTSPVESASSGSQSDFSQEPTPRDSEVFDFGVQDNCEDSISEKKKMKTRSSSLSRFFSRGKQRKPVFKLVVRGKWQSVYVADLFRFPCCLCEPVPALGRDSQYLHNYK